MNGLVQENLGNRGNPSANMWIKQLEQPRFLPQQIDSLEEMEGDDIANECV